MKERPKTKNLLRRADLLRYLRGELPNENRFAFENRLLDDPEAMAALEGYVQAGHAPAEIEEQLDELVARYRQSRPNRPPYLRWLLLALLAAVLLWVAFTYNRRQSAQRLFAQYFDPVPHNGYVLTRGAPGASSALLQALDWYEAGDYHKSLTAFHQLSRGADSPRHAQLYAGLSALQLGRFPAALTYFQRILDEPGLPRADARWYTALAQLQRGNLRAARRQLQILVREEGDYAAEAGNLLQALDE